MEKGSCGIVQGNGKFVDVPGMVNDDIEIPPSINIRQD